MNKLLKEFKELSDLKSSDEEFKKTNPESFRKKVINISGAIVGFFAFTIGMTYVEESDVFIFVGITGMMIMMYSIKKLVEWMMD